MRGGAPEFQRRLGGDRFDVRDAAHAVGAKNFLSPVNMASGQCTAPALFMPVVIAEEDALVFQTKERRPFQRKLLDVEAAQDNRRPLLVFAFQNILSLFWLPLMGVR